jgi:small subunit ribosomal protein S20
MPILANAKKALRGSKRKAVFNQRVKSMVKTATDAMRKTPSQKNLDTVYSAIDKAVKRNIFHKNKAARLKAHMAKLMPNAK